MSQVPDHSKMKLIEQRGNMSVFEDENGAKHYLLRLPPIVFSAKGTELDSEAEMTEA